MVLECRLPGCMKRGVDYYTASLSFDQERIERYSMRLTFSHDLPQWVRTYECRADGDVKLGSAANRAPWRFLSSLPIRTVSLSNSRGMGEVFRRFCEVSFGLARLAACALIWASSSANRGSRNPGCCGYACCSDVSMGDSLYWMI